MKINFTKFVFIFLFLSLIIQILSAKANETKKPSKEVPKQKNNSKPNPQNQKKNNVAPKKQKENSKKKQKPKKSKEELLMKEFKKEYKSKLQNVTMQYSFFIPIPKKKEIIMYENITKVPATLQGAYVLEEEMDKTLEFKVISPSGKTIYTKSKNYGIFILEVEKTGLYQFVFNNKFTKVELKPMFMINSGQNKILNQENLSITEKKMEDLVKFLKKFGQDIKLNRGNRKRRQEELYKTNTIFFLFSILETIVLIVVAAWQYFYMKHLFEVKGAL